MDAGRDARRARSLKVVYNPYPIGNFAIDGSYYYQVARHVANGDGLLTDVSLYHQGLSPLPHRSPIYPVWPLVLGAVGAVVGLHTAAVWLPELLYLASLVLLYQLTVAIGARMGEPTLVWWRGQPLMDVGHLLVVLFGCNAMYFRFTSLPFTEGLAFTLAFGDAARLREMRRHSLGDVGRPGRGVGGVVVPHPIPVPRPRACPSGLPGAVVLGTPLASPYAHDRNRLDRRTHFQPKFASSLRRLLHSRRECCSTSPPSARTRISSRSSGWSTRGRCWQTWWTSQGRLRRLFARISFLTFNPSAGLCTRFRLRCWESFRPRALKARLAAAYQPRTLVVTATIAAAVASVAPVHAMHATMYGGWFFQWRHGLPLVFSLTVAIAFLLSAAAPLYRLAALALIALSIWSCAHKVRDEISNQSKYHAPHGGAGAVPRVDRAPIPRNLFLATPTQVNTLAAITGGHFHSVSCIENPEQVGVFFDELQVNYLVTVARDQGCQFFKSISERLEGVMRLRDWQRRDRRLAPRRSARSSMNDASEYSETNCRS